PPVAEHPRCVMKLLRLLAPAACAAVALVAAAAPEPPPPPDDAALKKLRDDEDLLARKIDALRNPPLSQHDPFLADVEVYLKAAVWARTHNEYAAKDAV